MPSSFNTYHACSSPLNPTMPHGNRLHTSPSQASEPRHPRAFLATASPSYFFLIFSLSPFPPYPSLAAVETGLHAYPERSIKPHVERITA